MSQFASLLRPGPLSIRATYTGTEAASMYGQFALSTDRSSIWDSGETSKFGGEDIYSTTTLWHGNGVSKSVVEMSVPTRILKPGENIELASEAKFTLTLPTLDGGPWGKCGEECMSSSKFWATHTGTSSAPLF